MAIYVKKLLIVIEVLYTLHDVCDVYQSFSAESLRESIFKLILGKLFRKTVKILINNRQMSRGTWFDSDNSYSSLSVILYCICSG